MPQEQTLEAIHQVTQATLAPTNGAAHQGVIDLLLGSDWVVQLTLLILIFFSIVCWAIIIYKYRQYGSSFKASQWFWSAFSKAESLEDLAASRRHAKGPLYEVFFTAITFLPHAKKRGKLDLEGMERRIGRTRADEIYKLEQSVPFLATTASVTPFIGLFGTVCGILTAFWKIGQAGSSTLATVGPYIAEALIATAAGLAAAIPAVIFYNYFVNRGQVIKKMMDLFIDDLLARLGAENQ